MSSHGDSSSDPAQPRPTDDKLLSEGSHGDRCAFSTNKFRIFGHHTGGLPHHNTHTKKATYANFLTLTPWTSSACQKSMWHGSLSELTTALANDFWTVLGLLTPDVLGFATTLPLPRRDSTAAVQS